MSKPVNLQPFDFPIVGGSNDVPQDDPEYTLNMYAEKVSDEVSTLKPSPGTTLKNQFGINGGGRGAIVASGREFGVRGAFFQEMVGDVPTVKGTLKTTSNIVAMIACVPPPTSGLHAQILIVDDIAGYVYDLETDSFVTLTSAGGFVGGGSQAAFCAGRAFVFKPGTNEFQCSDLYDFTTWNGSAFKSDNSLSTPLLALASNGQLLYVWSGFGFSVWQDNGDNSFIPVSRILAGDRIGIMAPNSVLASNQYMYWLGGNNEGRGVVYRHTGGGRPERISDNSTERNIADMDTPSDASAVTYQSLGHIFYILTFRKGNRTFCYDGLTGLWADRAQRDPDNGNMFALPFVSIIIFDGEIYGMDYRDGKMDLISNKVYSDRGAPIIRERKTSVSPKEADFLTFFGSVELFGEWGNPA